MSKKKFRFTPLTRFLAAFLITLLVLGGAAVGLYFYIFSGMKTEDPLSNDEAGIVAQDYHYDHITNIALFGIDTTENSMNGRSDCIVIVTIDKKMKEIRLSAVQRDTYVEIEGHGKTKLNHAYAYGGASLAVKTLNQVFGLNINNYAVINFTNMEKVIDILGGIELEVSSAYRKEANIHIDALAWERGIKSDPIPGTGLQELSGMQVLGMLRARDNVGGTAARSAMHETVLTACYKKITKMSLVDYPTVAKELLSLVKTTLTSGDVTGLGSKILFADYEIRNAVFPLEVDQKNGYGGKIIKGVWYLTYNEEPGQQHLRDFIYDGKLYEE